MGTVTLSLLNIGGASLEKVPLWSLTAASLSKRAKSSFSVMTNSCAVHWDARLVKPSMSANKMLLGKEKKRSE